MLVAPVLVVLSGLWVTTEGAPIDGWQPRGRAKTHTVTIEATSFQPERLTVAAGDTVVWINKDPFPHTATSSSGAFDSGNIAPDRSWKRKLAKRGDFSYVCSLHPTMKGLITVK